MSLLDYGTILIHDDGFFTDAELKDIELPDGSCLEFSPKGLVYKNNDQDHVVQNFNGMLNDSSHPIVKYWNYKGVEFKTKLIKSKNSGAMYLTTFKNIDVWAHILQGYDVSLDKCWHKSSADYINNLLKKYAHFNEPLVKVIKKEQGYI